jgi:hypothetical protein
MNHSHYAGVDFATIEVADRIPAVFRSDQSEAFPDLAGATIERIGTPVDCLLVEGGGLVIDYIDPKDAHAKRLVLGFTELGMWVVFQGNR